MALLVNGERIDDATLREEVRLVRRLLIERLPREEASTVEEKAHEWARENLIERLLLKQSPPPDQYVGKPRHKDIVEYYKKNREDFHSPEAIHARHIVKNVDEQNDEESARTAIAQIQLALQGGAGFEQLADEQSDCPGRGGDLGYFARGQMVKEFDEVAFATPVGTVSEIFRTPFGFHILKVEGRQAEGILPLDAVRTNIEEHLFRQKKQKAIEQYADNLRARAEIREE